MSLTAASIGNRHRVSMSARRTDSDRMRVRSRTGRSTRHRVRMRSRIRRACSVRVCAAIVNGDRVRVSTRRRCCASP